VFLKQWVTTRNERRTEGMYARFSDLDRGLPITQEKLQELALELKNSEQLARLYSGPLAQRFLLNQDGISAEQLGTSALDLVLGGKDAAPLIHYKEFSNISLLVGLGALHQALERSRELQTRINKNGTERRLEFFNLLRIASLEREMGAISEEKKTIEQLEKQKSESVFPILYSEQITLTDYLQHRKNIH